MTVQYYKANEASNIVAQLGGAPAKKAYESIQKIVEDMLLRSLAIGPAFDPLAIVFRARTLQVLLEGVRERLGEEDYATLIFRVGNAIGIEFGHAMISKLKDAERIPSTYKAVITTWAALDRSAHWWSELSVESFSISKLTGMVRITGNFLSSGYTANEHRHCAFLEGYIQGVIDESFKEWTRWMVQESGIASLPFLTCISAKELGEKGSCVFNLAFRTESLIRSRNKFVNAIDRLATGKPTVDAVRAARAAMENSLKEKIGEDESARWGFYSALKCYEKAGATSISFGEVTKQAKKRYDFASAVVHGGKKANKQEAWDFAMFVNIFINEVERLDLNQSQMDFVKSCVRRKAPGSKRPKGSVFICYSSQDRSFVEKLAKDLVGHGIQVWYDRWEIKVGDSITRKISEGIKRNDYLCVVLSPDSVQSKWVERELSAGLLRELNRRSVVVLPLLIKDCEIPPLIVDKRYADFRTSYKKGLDDLLGTLLIP